MSSNIDQTILILIESIERSFKISIKNAIWFIKESKKFTGYGSFRMLFKENLISKTIRFCKEVKVY